MKNVSYRGNLKRLWQRISSIDQPLVFNLCASRLLWSYQSLWTEFIYCRLSVPAHEICWKKLLKFVCYKLWNENARFKAISVPSKNYKHFPITTIRTPATKNSTQSVYLRILFSFCKQPPLLKGFCSPTSDSKRMHTQKCSNDFSVPITETQGAPLLSAVAWIHVRPIKVTFLGKTL